MAKDGAYSMFLLVGTNWSALYVGNWFFFFIMVFFSLDNHGC